MIKASVLAMGLLTILISMGLRWRENRMAATQRLPRLGMVARGKRTFDRWVTAAAIATGATLVILGGLHWLRLTLD
ncbi:hypothetical protein [Neoroseomonas lacus]|uniref:Uncharacterized protein n=1 Tax=Neoroseomonas lacus TaxID=287609 RepID=A0A917NQU7_9PROT|nr:hypothetical protein [Neoroseomonas lacus]GGJ16834.1 hypothetical protein GCM10011320_25300 [Neoroseomonas lacus]